MIPAIELALESKVRVYIYIPPFQHSNALANATPAPAVKMQMYESRFKKSILPDTIHLETADFDLHIPDKWKAYQSSI